MPTPDRLETQARQIDKSRKAKNLLFKSAARVVLPLAAITSVAAPALDRGITLIPRPPLSQDFIAHPELAEQFAAINPITIVHRAGNTDKGIIEAGRLLNKESSEKKVNIFAEMDIVKVGDDLYRDHGQTFKNPVPLLDNVISHVGFDADSVTFRTGLPDYTMDSAFMTAGKSGIGLFLDLKRGDINEGDIIKVKNLSEKYGVKVMLHSGREDLVDMAVRVLSKLEKQSPEKTLVLDVPASPDSWSRFFTKIRRQDAEGLEEKKHRGVLTDHKSAIGYQSHLKDAYVIVGDANTPELAMSSMDSKVVSGFMWDTPLSVEN